MEGELRRAQFWRELAKKHPKFDLVRNIFYNINNGGSAYRRGMFEFGTMALLALCLALLAKQIVAGE